MRKGYNITLYIILYNKEKDIADSNNFIDAVTREKIKQQ